MSTGDRLLKLVARRLKSALPRSALLARMGGNEFAILLEPAPEAQSLWVLGEPLHRAFARSVLIGSQEAALQLLALGCELGQGYYFARALPVDQATQFLQRAAWSL